MHNIPCLFRLCHRALQRGAALKILSLWGLVFFLAAGGAQGDDAAEAAALFTAANQTYAAAVNTDVPEKARSLFAQAARRYEKLIADQGGNGKLYYNLGNCYSHCGDKGQAVLAYRRAAEYMPNDPNLQRNLEFVRAQLPERISPPADSARHILLFWHYDFPPSVRRNIAAGAFAAFWILLILRLYARKRYLSRGLLVVSGGLALMFGASVVGEAVSQKKHPDGVLLQAEVTARQGDGESYPPAFKGALHAGTEFTLMERRGAWWKIVLADGRDCWIPAAAGELLHR